MGFGDGEIILDSETGSYYAGQTLYGKLRFQQGKVKTFRGIYVQVKGVAHVHWTTRHSRTRNGKTESYTVSHNADEEYFRVKEYLIGSPKGEYHLQKGDHEFPFQCHIPPQCPSSYDGAHGYVQYKIKVVVDRAFKMDQEIERVFDVHAPLDLKADPSCRNPLECELEDSYCSWCVSAGSCHTVVKLPQSGYCVGETAPVELSCVNTSSVTIKKIKLQIVKRTTFHAHSAPGTKSVEEKILEISKGSVPGGTTRTWNLELEIPIMDPCNLAGCGVIDVDYYFEIKVKTSGLHSNSEQSRKFIIGDEPLNDTETIAEDGDDDRTSQTNQPLVQNDTHTSYPMAQAPYTQLQPYPGGNLGYPGGNSPYPGGNPSYPVSNSPYPGANSPYPAGNSPYPAGNAPYPGGNPPYPNLLPNVPYIPGSHPGNQGTIPPYPGSIPMPLPSDPTKSPSIGFRMPNEGAKAEVETLPPYPTNARPVSPYAGASAPAIIADDQSNESPVNPHQTPYNPEFMKEEKK